VPRWIEHSTREQVHDVAHRSARTCTSIAGPPTNFSSTTTSSPKAETAARRDPASAGRIPFSRGPARIPLPAAARGLITRATDARRLPASTSSSDVAS